MLKANIEVTGEMDSDTNAEYQLTTLNKALVYAKEQIKEVIHQAQTCIDCQQPSGNIVLVSKNRAAQF